MNTDALKVEWWAMNEHKRLTRHPAKTSIEIRSAIVSAFTLDPRVSLFAVQPEVVGSIVTLTGVVSNLRTKKAAENIARHTTGVSHVVNEIKVSNSKMTDEEMQNAIERAFDRNVITDALNINVTFENGVVTLAGRVESLAEKAEAIAARTPGVIRVKNNVAVSKF